MSISQIIKGNYWMRSGLLSLMQNVSTIFFSFVTFYLLIRILDKEDYGAWILFLTTITIIEITRNGLIQNATIKHLAAGGQHEKKDIISASFFVNISVTLFFIVIIFAVAPLLSKLWSTPELTEMLYIYNLAFFISGLQIQFNSVEQAFLNFKGLFLSSLSNQVLFFIYITSSYFSDHHPRLVELVYVTVVMAVVSTFVSWLYARKHLVFRRSLSFLWVKKIINYGKYSMGTAVNAQLSATVDQMMLGAMLSPAATSVYNIAIRISNLANIPTNAIATIVFPQGSKRAETEGPTALKYLYEKSVGSILAVLVPSLVFIFIFADPIIHFIASEKYNDAIPLLKITLLYSLFIPFSRQTGTILESVGKTKLNFYLVLFTGISNLLLNFSFISYWGILGAAYATLITNFVFFVISQYFNRKLFNINLLNPWIYAIRFYPEMFRKIFPKKPVE